MKSVFQILLLLTFLACKTTEKKALDSQDTTKIISAILNGEEFLKENLNVNTLYFLRNKLFNESWFKTKSQYKIKSIEDNSRSRMANIGLSYPYDSRERLSVFKFDQKGDTVDVGIYEHGGNLFYETTLVRKEGSWVILNQKAYNGGRMEKFEFEDEEWYKNLKKEVKPHKPMFPPSEPK